MCSVHSWINDANHWARAVLAAVRHRLTSSLRGLHAARHESSSVSLHSVAAWNEHLVSVYGILALLGL
jgi:hypothetical protein